MDRETIMVEKGGIDSICNVVMQKILNCYEPPHLPSVFVCFVCLCLVVIYVSFSAFLRNKMKV